MRAVASARSQYAATFPESFSQSMTGARAFRRVLGLWRSASCRDKGREPSAQQNYIASRDIGSKASDETSFECAVVSFGPPRASIAGPHQCDSGLEEQVSK